MSPLLDPTRNPTRRMVVDELRRLLPQAEGWPADVRTLRFDLAALDAHLPQGGLACGALHEVVPAKDGDGAAAFGFVAALLGRLRGAVLFVMSAQHGRPSGHGLSRLGLNPARLILVEADDPKQALWAMEEGLRSAALSAVVGALDHLDLKTSQRLQFAARETGVPLMLLRPARTLEASAATTRWRVGTAEAARDRHGLVTRWRWRLGLERCRNGRPGEWVVEFDHVAHRFSLAATLADPALSHRAGAQACA